ncbi:Uncharacterized protein HZ326_30016 [Fusarium oxysporum f. sp. albedinis]|nr:Uncharacterized protein HZ326_30016 [Fusarium oxysporum f. sp. albedinis]
MSGGGRRWRESKFGNEALSRPCACEPFILYFCKYHIANGAAQMTAHLSRRHWHLLQKRCGWYRGTFVTPVLVISEASHGIEYT